MDLLQEENENKQKYFTKDGFLCNYFLNNTQVLRIGSISTTAIFTLSTSVFCIYSTHFALRIKHFLVLTKIHHRVQGAVSYTFLEHSLQSQYKLHQNSEVTSGQCCHY